MDKLIKQIKSLHPDIELSSIGLASWFQTRQLNKGETLLPFQSVCRHYYFVNKGSLRIFFLEDGQEYTSWFAFEDYFFTELESYLQQTFSNYTIVATEETEILEISKNDMDDLLAKFDWWKEFLLFSQHQTILKLMEVVRSFQAQSAKKRYEDLFNYPYLIQRTKQKDLSSMLGITPHSLSRIRKK